MVAYVEVSYEVSERRACEVLSVARSMQRYRSVADRRTEVRTRLRDLAARRPHWGYRRLGLLCPGQAED
jgi:putative transposase